MVDTLTGHDPFEFESDGSKSDITCKLSFDYENLCSYIVYYLLSQIVHPLLLYMYFFLFLLYVWWAYREHMVLV